MLNLVADTAQQFDTSVIGSVQTVFWYIWLILERLLLLTKTDTRGLADQVNEKALELNRFLSMRNEPYIRNLRAVPFSMPS